MTEVLSLEPQIRHHTDDQVMRQENYAQYAWLGSIAAFFERFYPDNEETWLDPMWRTLIAEAGTRDGYTGRAKSEWKDAVFEWWSVLYLMNLEFLKHDRNTSEASAVEVLGKEQTLLQKYVRKVDLEQKSIGDFGCDRAAHRERRVFVTESGMTGLGPPS